MNTLRFENYRGFQDFRLGDLSTVNLLVGKNNSGKTTVLEGIHLLGSAGDPSVLMRTASRRGEIIFADDIRDEVGRDYLPDASHLFYGHRFGINSSFRILGESTLGGMTVRVTEAPEPGGDEANKQMYIERPVRERFGRLTDELVVQVIRDGGEKGETIKYFIPATVGGGLIWPGRAAGLRFRNAPSFGTSFNTLFITPDSLDAPSMRGMWDQVILEGREHEVIENLKLLEPHIDSIFFLSGRASIRESRSGVVVGTSGETTRIPLGSFGDGMRRLLALSLALIQAKGGYLLVDEIDTGFHYSIMGDMWRLVIGAAIQSGVTVFATTHSYDCVRGLAWVCDNYPELDQHISLQKIDPSLKKSVAVHPSELVLAEKAGVEVR